MIPRLLGQPLATTDPLYNICSQNTDHASSFQLLSKTALIYAGSAAIFVIYGIQVCPFLESLERNFFISVVLSLFIGMFLLRTWVCNNNVKGSPRKILSNQFFTDLSIFFIGGLALAIGNYLVYQFPLSASIRVIIGFSILGFFNTLLLMLYTENKIIRAPQRVKHSDNEKPIFIRQKIQLFVFSLLLSAVITLLLVIYKDFEWLQSIGSDVSIDQAALWILYEFIFVSLVFLSYGFVLTRNFSKNIDLYFCYQNSVLSAVNSGKRDIEVPIINRDEFSFMAEQTNRMIDSLRDKEECLKTTRDAAILAISSLAETRDNETGAHILRTQAYVKALGSHLQKNTRFSHYLSDERLELICKSAPLHDIGKVGIPDAILLKPGKLTVEEFDTMKQHPLIGVRAIEKAEEHTGTLPFLHYAKEISETHHEKWDGSGYPFGLQGENIPLSGRLMALADVYDALITKRVYKPAFSHEKARAIITDGKGSHFDPELVDAFLAIEDQFIATAKQYED